MVGDSIPIIIIQISNQPSKQESSWHINKSSQEKMTTEENVECVICLEPLTSQTVLECCRQPCHQQCVNQWKNVRHTISCSHCRQMIPIVVLNHRYKDSWKKDQIFARKVKQVWRDNTLWFGARNDGYEWKTGFWGELKDPYEPNKKTFCFLVLTKSHVIARMRTYLSFS